MERGDKIEIAEIGGPSGLPDDADRLFTAPLSEFTKTRNELAKELKASGDSEGALKVAALVKPTAAAWALNQVARTDAGTIRQLEDADESLRNPGSGADLRAASAKRNQIVGKIVQAASNILSEGGHNPSAAVIEKITRTLLAVGTDEQARRVLIEGRLMKDLEPGGFADDMWGAVVGGSAAAAQPRTDDKDELDAKRRRKALEAEISRLTEEADQARRESDEARDRANKARLAANKAEAEAKQAAKRAEEAAAALEREKAQLSAESDLEH